MSGKVLSGILLKSGIAVPSTRETRRNSVAIDMDFTSLESKINMVYCLMDLSDSLTFEGRGIAEIERVAQAGKQAWKIAESRGIPFTAIPFSSDARTIDLTDESFDSLVRSDLACGGTALDKALDLVKKKDSVVIIVTDGDPNSTILVDEWMTENPDAPIYVIGMGAGAKEEMLTWLARGDATRQSYCQDAGAVKTKLEQFVISGGSIATKAELTIELKGGIEPMSIYRAFPKYTSLDGDWQNSQITVDLGAVGGHQAVCVDFIAPARKSAGARIIAHVNYGQTEDVEIEIPYVKGNQISIDSEVAKWVDSAKRDRRISAIDRIAKSGKQDMALQKAQELVQDTRRGGGDLLGPMIKIMKEIRDTGQISDKTRRYAREELSDTQRKAKGVFDNKLTSIKDEI